MKRFGQLIGLRPEVLEEYKRYHAAVWPEILEAIRKAGIRNYSIFHFDGKLLNEEKVMLEWVGHNGIDAKKFAEIYGSPAIQAKLGGAPTR